MEKIIFISLALMLSGCQWVLTHPSEDAEIVNIVEEIGKDLYNYEKGAPNAPTSTPQ